MSLFKQIACLSILTASIHMRVACLSDEVKNAFVGAACIICPAIAEGQQAKGEVKGLREQNQTLQINNQTLQINNQTLQINNQTLQSSLESANARADASQATQAAQMVLIGNITNDLAAAHIAKQQVEIASAKAIKEGNEKLYSALQQISTRDAALAVVGVTLAIGATAVVAYVVYRGVSSYVHNKSKTAAHQQLKTCIEGDDTSLAKSRNCEKEFHEFARYAQGEELLLGRVPKF